MMLYLFRCWERHDDAYLPSLIANCKRTGRIAYFDSAVEISFDITSMATSTYECEGQPLIALALASQSSRTTLFAPLNELADAIASEQNDALWRLLCQVTRGLAPQHRLA
ncbi:hypothetical protein vBCbaSRXM_27 [Citromicrobium phage vB_CbaS-RXM]|nr:hypothetical protein vBCbaSRXM_27 [Citromicrobium phage vB_CbaS-RXM]